MEWNWWVNLGFSLAGLVFVVIAMQQKTVARLLWFRVVAVSLIVVGLCFLGVASLIILAAAGLIQLGVALLFDYKPKTPIAVKWVMYVLLGISIVVLQIVFWNPATVAINIMAIVYGLGALVAAMLKSAALIRKLTVPICVLGIVMYGFSLAPINAAMDFIALVGAVVGIIRLDIKKESAEGTAHATAAAAENK